MHVTLQPAQVCGDGGVRTTELPGGAPAWLRARLQSIPPSLWVSKVVESVLWLRELSYVLGASVWEPRETEAEESERPFGVAALICCSQGRHRHRCVRPFSCIYLSSVLSVRSRGPSCAAKARDFNEDEPSGSCSCCWGGVGSLQLMRDLWFRSTPHLKRKGFSRWT